MSRSTSLLRSAWSAIVRFWQRQGNAGKVIVALAGLALLLCPCYSLSVMVGGPAPPTAALRPAANGVTLIAPESSTSTPVPPSIAPTAPASSTARATPASTSVPLTDTPLPTSTDTPVPPTNTPEPPTATAAPTETATGSVQAQVVEVVDGDTIKVSFDGQIHTVRYIGIDTPETAHPDRPVEWMGPQASAQNAELVAGQIVTLERDVSETDRYGRLLCYVYVGDLMVNAELVRLGYAQVSTYPPDVKYQDLFLQMQAEARAAGRGLWGPTPTPAPPPVEPPPSEAPAPQQPPPQEPSREGCDPAYPDVCIPPPPPDLDCGDIAYLNFRVLPPDPHRFDRDKDGIGCER